MIEKIKIDKELIEYVKKLVNHYVCNPDTNSEFICCITPESKEEDEVWQLWDKVRKGLNEHRTSAGELEKSKKVIPMEIDYDFKGDETRPCKIKDGWDEAGKTG